MVEVVANVSLLCAKCEFVAQKMDLETWKQMGFLRFEQGHAMLFLCDGVVQTLVVALVVLKGLNLYVRGRVVEMTIVPGVGLFSAGVDVESC